MKNAFAAVIAIFFSSILMAAPVRSAVDYFSTAQGLEANRKYYEAIENYEEAIRLNPNYRDAYFGLAYCAYYLEQYDLALKYLEEAERGAAQSAPIDNLRGFILTAQGETAAAEKLFESVLKRTPNDGDARFGLAQIRLYNGDTSGARSLYEDALKRASTSKRALLSLALVTARNGDFATCEKYLTLALKAHNDDALVHYMAAFLYSKKGSYKEAIAQAKEAIGIDPDYTDAYKLLAGIYFIKGQYKDVCSICLFLLDRERNLPTVWYLYALSQDELKDTQGAVKSLETALELDPNDEVARGALEVLASDKLELKSPVRARLSIWHQNKGEAALKSFDNKRAVYELNRALALNPYNNDARHSYNSILKTSGSYEMYLQQLEFLNKNGAEGQSDWEKTTTADTVEALKSMLTYSIAQKWKIEPFYLDKSRLTYGLYYSEDSVELLHPKINRITASMLEMIFSAQAKVRLSVYKTSVSSVKNAFTLSRKAKEDFFVVLSAEEDPREVTLHATLYNSGTGAKVKQWSIFRTGNDRYCNALLRLQANLTQDLPVTGKILARSGSTLLVDLGKTDGIGADFVFDIVKAGSITVSDKDSTIGYKDSAVLGQLKITKVGEEVSEGEFTSSGFYDRLNIKDEVYLTSRPKEASDEAVAEGAQSGEGENRPMSRLEDSDSSQSSSRALELFTLIKGIH